MLRVPSEVEIDESGRAEIPMGILVEAGLTPGIRVLAYSAGDGRIVLRRAEDALAESAETGNLP